MNKRTKVAARKHGQAQRKLTLRRQEALKAGAKRISKSKLHRLVGPPIHPGK